MGNYLVVNLFERSYCESGSSFPICETKIGNIGMQVCYDLLFPEASRIAALKGAEVLVNISAGIVGLEIGYNFFLPARAQENIVYLIYVNIAGEQKGTRFFGHSRIIHPSGLPTVECNIEKEDFKVASVNLEELENLRSLTPFLKDRRSPEVYKEIAEEFRKL